MGFYRTEKGELWKWNSPSAGQEAVSLQRSSCLSPQSAWAPLIGLQRGPISRRLGFQRLGCTGWAASKPRPRAAFQNSTRERSAAARASESEEKEQGRLPETLRPEGARPRQLSRPPVSRYLLHASPTLSVTWLRAPPAYPEHMRTAGRWL